MISQRYESGEVDLLRINSNDATPFNVTVPFRFANAGPRVMTTIKVLARQPGQAMPFDWTIAGTLQFFLWLYRIKFDETGARVPVANILGTQAGPVQIDTGAALSTCGVSIDCQIGGDGIDGELTMVETAAYSLVDSITIAARARYNAVAPLCDDEWARFRQSFGGYPSALRATAGNALVWG